MYENLLREVADYHGDLVRNIQTIRVSQDLFDDLSPDRGDQAFLVLERRLDQLHRHPVRGQSVFLEHLGK